MHCRLNRRRIENFGITLQNDCFANLSSFVNPQFHNDRPLNSRSKSSLGVIGFDLLDSLRPFFEHPERRGLSIVILYDVRRNHTVSRI